jgi:carbon storage regulator
MLMLSRKTDQSVCVGDDIVITVIGTSRGRVQLGFSAPEEVRVVRSELETDIQSNRPPCREKSGRPRAS